MPGQGEGVRDRAAQLYYGDHEVLAAIIFVAQVWAKLPRLVLDELGKRGDLDWSRCAIDLVNMCATIRRPRR